MDWKSLKYWFFKEKRLKVIVVTANNGKTIQKFVAKSMTQGPKTRIFKLENGLKIRISNELSCIVSEVWMYDGAIKEE